MRIAIGADHAGFALKQHLIQVLKERGLDIDDRGTDSEEPVDYPPICADVGRIVASRDADFGIVLGGSGQGEQISANKVHGVRAALCNELYTARFARAHNDANVLSMGARIVAAPLAEAILDVFLQTPFEGGRHVARLEQIARIEATAERPEGSGAWSRPMDIEATAERPEGSGARSRPMDIEATAERPEGSGAWSRPMDIEATAERPEGSGARSRPMDIEATAERPEGSGARSRPGEAGGH